MGSTQPQVVTIDSDPPPGKSDAKSLEVNIFEGLTF